MQISDAVIRASRNLAKKKTKTDQKKTEKQKTDQKQTKNRPKTKTALFRANKHLEKFIISNCRSV